MEFEPAYSINDRYRNSNTRTGFKSVQLISDNSPQWAHPCNQDKTGSENAVTLLLLLLASQNMFPRWTSTHSCLYDRNDPTQSLPQVSQAALLKKIIPNHQGSPLLTGELWHLCCRYWVVVWSFDNSQNLFYRFCAAFILLFLFI